MILIRNGRLMTMEDNMVIDGGDILISGSTIKEVGKDLQPPEGATIIDATGKNVMPGFIDAHTHLGMRKSGVKPRGGINNSNEKSDSLTPHGRGIDNCCPKDVTFTEAVEAGVTSCCITPGSSNIIGGTAFFAKTYGNNIDDMVVKNPVAMKGALGENPMGYGERGKAPYSRIGVAMMFREIMYKAKEYMERLDSEDKKDPDFDLKLHSLLPVLRKEIPMMIHAHSAGDIMTAIRLAKEFDIDMTIEHCSGGAELTEELREAGYPCIVGPLLTFKGKPEVSGKSWHLPGILDRADIEVCITTDATVTPVYTLAINAALAVKKGMDYNSALRAITINAAKVRGVDDRVGSLKVGKDADIVIWDGCPLEISSRNTVTIINGEIVYRDDTL